MAEQNYDDSVPLGADTLSTGGGFEGRAKIIKARIITNSYGEKQENPHPALQLTLRPQDGTPDTQENLKAGDLKYLAPRPDGYGFRSVGRAGNTPHVKSKYGAFVASLKPLGFSFSRDIRDLEGMDAEFKQVQIAMGDDFKKKREGQAKEGVPVKDTYGQLVVTRIYEMPKGSGGGGQAEESGGGDDTDTSAPAKSSKKGKGQTAESKLVAFIVGKVGEDEKGVGLKALTKAVYSEFASDPDRGEMMPLLGDDAWLSNQAGFDFDKKSKVLTAE